VGKLRVRQIKSGLGAPRKIRRTLEALGLKHQRSVVKPDNPAVRGMLFKIKHLVEVEPVSGNEEKGS
jgi:large subunit ribosomal protein L30